VYQEIKSEWEMREHAPKDQKRRNGRACARTTEGKGGWDGVRQGIRSGGDGNACARGPKVKGRGGALQEIKRNGKNGHTWMNQR